MIHYSSINDAWGNKEIYKNNKEDFSQNNNKPSVTINTNSQPIKNENNVKKIENEHFSPTTTTTMGTDHCMMAEHMKNCPECKKKLSEMFTNSDNNREIKICGFTINLTKDVLKIIFIILLILISVNLFSLINILFPEKPMYLYPTPAAMNNMNNMMKYTFM
jgi:hypothetical protein